VSVGLVVSIVVSIVLVSIGILAAVVVALIRRMKQLRASLRSFQERAQSFLDDIQGGTSRAQDRVEALSNQGDRLRRSGQPGRKAGARLPR
jgi:hypothetical protein